MSTKSLTRVLFLASLTVGVHPAPAEPEAFEVSAQNFSELPGGKEADGIVGDFVLRNDLVAAVISQNAPDRKANMGTFWGASGSTPGCLYDLSHRGKDDDQITIFAPFGQRGDVSYVRVAEDAAEGEAAIETVITATKGNGLSLLPPRWHARGHHHHHPQE